MIICHSKKFIFVHNPKTGGMTLTKLLKSLLVKGDIIISSPYIEIVGRPTISDFINKVKYNQFPYSLIPRQTFKIINLEKHSTSLEINYATGNKIWENYYKFCFVRNPYDRCVSGFFWIKKNKGNNIKNERVKKLMQKISSFPDFEHFVRSVEFEQIKKEQFLRPMVDRIYNSQNKSMVDYVGKIENFAQELEKLSLELDSIIKNNNMYLNQSLRQKNYRTYYTSETRKIVERSYYKDITEFGYDF